MRKVASASILALTLVLVVVTPSSGQRRGGPPRGRPRGRVIVNVGPYWGRPYLPPPYYVYAPPPVIVQPTPVFVHQQPVIVQQSPPAAPPQGPSAAPPQQYWYYCLSAEAYYPTVPSCPEAWIMVPSHPG